MYLCSSVPCTCVGYCHCCSGMPGGKMAKQVRTSAIVGRFTSSPPTDQPNQHHQHHPESGAQSDQHSDSSQHSHQNHHQHHHHQHHRHPDHSRLHSGFHTCAISLDQPLSMVGFSTFVTSHLVKAPGGKDQRLGNPHTSGPLGTRRMFAHSHAAVHANDSPTDS